MCDKYSFLLTRAGKLLDGGGLTESHSEIASLHKVDEDKCNRYEWQPPKGWPDAEPWDGITVDREVFTPAAAAIKRIETHLTGRFPTVAAFEVQTPVDERWHEQTVTINGCELTIYVRGVHEVSTGAYWAFDSASVEAFGSASVEAFGSASVRAFGSASVRASGSASVRAFGSASVRASGSASVRAFDSASVRASGSASVEAFDSASVRAFGSASVRASDSASVRAFGSASVRASGSASVEAFGSASVEAFGSASVRAFGSASVRASGSASVEAFDSASVRASGSASVVIPAAWADKVSATVNDQAVLIDRRNGKLVITTAADAELKKS